jgi:hypothetical protein
MNSANIPFEAIVELVEYLEHDERRHFEDMQHDGEDVSGHIHLSVRAVTDWLADQGIAWRDPQAEFKASVESAFDMRGVAVVDEN